MAAMTTVNITKTLINNGFLSPKHTVFLLCDLQEKFRPAISHFDELVKGASKLVEVSKILEIPLIVTEQYPTALGATVQDVNKGHALGTFPKTKFSMCIPEVMKHLDNFKKDVAHPSVVLFGIEAHACIEQTAVELRSDGWNVHVVGDATSSRSIEDRMLAFERMKQIGCFITTTETVIFKLLVDKNNPKFNDTRHLVKNVTPNTGLARL